MRTRQTAACWAAPSAGVTAPTPGRRAARRPNRTTPARTSASLSPLYSTTSSPFGRPATTDANSRAYSGTPWASVRLRVSSSSTAVGPVANTSGTTSSAA